MSKLFIPKGYKSPLNLAETEKGIKLVKDNFEAGLSAELKLRRVTAPLFVLKDTGINDDLNGTEHKVAFPIMDMDNRVAEIVNSLAKWKRMVLADYGFQYGYGLYTDMNAIRPDEELDNLHSMYVDQWDWERVISEEDRNLDFLKYIVRKIYEVVKRTEYIIYEHYPKIEPVLPDEITFLHSEELLEMFPDPDPRERENQATKKFGAIFVIGIGGKLKDGKLHDGRAPDYDDWVTETHKGYKGLNGDIILWNPLLERAFEISSMGIRVNKESMLEQLKLTGTESRKDLYWHKRLLNGELPQSVGGGLGESRICMFFLRKAHVGEVQATIWPGDMIKECKKNDIFLM